MRQPPRRKYVTGSNPKTGSGSSNLAAAPYSGSGTYSQSAAPFTTGHSTLAAASGTLSARENQQMERTQPPHQATADKEGTQPKTFTKTELKIKSSKLD